MRVPVLLDERLMNTPTVVLRQLQPAFRAGDDLELSVGGKTVGARIARVESGETAVMADPNLYQALGGKACREAEIEKRIFPPARRVELSAPGPFTGKRDDPSDYAFLQGRPLTASLIVNRYVIARDAAVPVTVLTVDPGPVAVVTDKTELVVSVGPDAVWGSATTTRQGISYADIGGLGKEILRIREMLEYPLRNAEVFGLLGVQPPRGVILWGPPGTGKTLIAKALSNELGAYFVKISGPEVFDKYYGETERALREKFDEARQNRPSIVLIDELDAIAAKRSESHGDLERRLVTQLLTCMDGLDDASGMTIIGTTNRLDAIDPALRRGGRFEKEIRIAAPDRHGREEILSLHLRGVATAADVDLRQLSDETVGFVGADLAALCREAAYCAMRRLFTEEQLRQGTAISEAVQVELTDFRLALKDVQPSALREFYIEIPDDVTWDSIGGLSDAKQLIEDNVVRPLQVPEAFAFIGAEPAQGLLLYGPPGTGKTHLARVTARRAGVNFIAIRGPELESKWRGEAERRLREVFSCARESAPCIIFFDEVDAIASQRRGAAEHEVSLLNQLLAEMDGLQQNSHIFVIAATNRVDIIDPALLRPGRFDYQVEVPLPDLDARGQIFAIHLRTIRAGELDYRILAQKTDGFSGADIAEACRRAALRVLRGVEFRPLETTLVEMDDILAGVEDVTKLMADVKPRRIGFQ